MKKIIITAFALSTLLFVSCKNEKEVGPSGKNGIDGVNGLNGKDGIDGKDGKPAKTLYSEGEARGLVKTTTLSGEEHEISFKFIGNEYKTSNYFQVLSTDETSIVITKEFTGTESDLIDGKFELHFTVDNLTSLERTTPECYVYILINKELSDEKNYIVEIDTRHIDLENLAYNQETRTLSGNFSLELEENIHRHGPIDVVDGYFSTKLHEVVAKVGN